MRKLLVVVLSVFALALVVFSRNAHAQAESYIGVVTKIDASAGKITIRHGAMPKFDLHDPHTMVFRASDPAMLKQVKAGDKVKFEADRVNGQFTVIKIEKTK